MGNTVSGPSTKQLSSFQDIRTSLDLSYSLVKELYGSRFFKVFEVLDKHRLSVLKVYHIPDGSDVTAYQQMILPYCAHVKNGFNILAQSIPVITQQLACLQRDFVEQSLFERFHTRPFLTLIEKRWITFQLLRAVSQLHATQSQQDEALKPLCHGDIKPENILVTAWGWLLLSDPAPFKPVIIPSDNPAKFTFFFDTSRRQACYLAPERLCDTHASPPEPGIDILEQPHQAANDSEAPSSAKDKSDAPADYTGLTPSMDLFSVGCVLVELFTDGTVLFRLSELLNYRALNDTRLMKMLDPMPDEHIKKLITNLLEREPTARKSSSQHLEEQRGAAFPEFFYGPFAGYMQSYLFDARQTPKVRLSELRKTLPEMLQLLGNEEDLALATVLLSNLVTTALRPAHESQSVPSHTPSNTGSDRTDRQNGVTASPCPLTESAKIDGIVSLLILSKHMHPEHLIDRVLPYLLDLAMANTSEDRKNSMNTSTSSREVRTLAINACGQVLQRCLDYLDTPGCPLPRFLSVNFLSTYLMPHLIVLSKIDDPIMQLALTRLFPIVVNVALKVKAHSCEATKQEVQRTESSLPVLEKRNAELMVLEKQVRDLFVKYFEEGQSDFVRHSLIDSGNLARFAALFGQSLTRNTIISSIITLLNNKQVPQLRAAFYQEICPLASFAGSQSFSFLETLIDSGLYDTNESVLESCLNLVVKMQCQQLLHGLSGVTWLDKMFVLTLHPSARIRQVAASFITSFARVNLARAQAPEADGLDTSFSRFKHCAVAIVYSRLSNKRLKTFLKRPIRHHMTDDSYILAHLQPHLSHSFIDSVFDVIKSVTRPQTRSELLSLFDETLISLHDRVSRRESTIKNRAPCYNSVMTENAGIVLAKLQTEAWSELREAQLVAFGDILRLMFSDRISSSPKPVPRDPRYQESATMLLQQRLIQRPIRIQSTRSSAGANDDARWADDLHDHLRLRWIEGRLPLPVNKGFRFFQEMRGRLFSLSPSADMYHDASLSRADEQYYMSGNFADPSPGEQERTCLYRELRSTSFEAPQGKLLVHLFEHKPGYLNLATHRSGELLASSSSGDGCVKFWNCSMDDNNSLEDDQSETEDPTCARFLPTRSTSTVSFAADSAETAACRHLVWTAQGNSVASLVGGQAIRLVDYRAGKMTGSLPIDVGQFGLASCLSVPYVISNEAGYVGASSGGIGGGLEVSTASNWNLLTYTTAGSYIIGQDLRVSSTSSSSHAFRLKQHRDHGLIRSMAIHSAHSWLVTGTSYGHLLNWDLRFQRQIAHSEHPNGRFGSMLNMRIYEANLTNQLSPLLEHSHTFIVTANEWQNEVALWDLEQCTSSSGGLGRLQGDQAVKTTFYPGVLSVQQRNSVGGRVAASWSRPLQALKSGRILQPLEVSEELNCLSVRSLLCLAPRPKNSTSTSLLPAVISGGTDARIRLWDFACPSNSDVIAFGGLEEPRCPKIDFKGKSLPDGTLAIIEDTLVSETGKLPPSLTSAFPADFDRASASTKQNGDASPSSTTPLASRLNRTTKVEVHPNSGALYIRQATHGHVNLVSDLTWVHAGQPFLVSASMDGVIKFWK